MAPASPRKALPEPKTPTRRSKRGQPVVTFNTGSRTEITWLNRNAPRERALDPAKDLDDSDITAWNNVDEDDQDAMRTHVHDGFCRTKTTATAAKKTKKALPKKVDQIETFCVGDTVLVATTTAEPSVAVIVGLWETDLKADPDEPLSSRIYVRIHWFLRQKQMPGYRVQRNTLENEIFYSVNEGTIICSDAILRHCNVRGDEQANLFDADSSCNNFYCRYSVNSQRGIFCEFDWSVHRKRALDTIHQDTNGYSFGDIWQLKIVDKVSKVAPKRKPQQSRTPRKTRQEEPKESSDEDHSSEDEFSPPSDAAVDEEDEDEEDEETDFVEVDDEDVQRPSKKRKRGKPPGTPRKKRKTTEVEATPHSRARKAPSSPRKRPKFTRVAQPSYASESLQNLPEDPYLRAMHILHVGSRPDALPCRDAEFQHVIDSVQTLLEEGSGGCVYISGVPGTGKTATVHAVIRELKKLAEANEINPFTYVEINGLRIPDPPTAYTILWEALSQQNIRKDGRLAISAKESLKNLGAYFSREAGRGPGAHACIVLMDELDQLVTQKQDVIYNFFNWPTIANSKLIVIAVANTHDLPERVMTGRVRSRLGMVRTNFAPYNTAQLLEIVTSRLDSVHRETDKVVIESAAVRLASQRVSNITGDARRILDVCRRAVETVRPAQKVATPNTIVEVMNVMQNNPTAAYLRDLSFHERVMLAALIKCMKQQGVEEIKWGDVQYQHALYVPTLAEVDEPKRRPTNYELDMVLESLVCSRAILLEDSVAASRNAKEDRKVLLNLEQSEVERVLGEGGEYWKKILN